MREKDRVSEAHTIADIPLVVQIHLIHVDIELAVVVTEGVEAVVCENNHLDHCRSKCAL